MALLLAMALASWWLSWRREWCSTLRGYENELDDGLQVWRVKQREEVGVERGSGNWRREIE